MGYHCIPKLQRGLTYYQIILTFPLKKGKWNRSFSFIYSRILNILFLRSKMTSKVTLSTFVLVAVILPLCKFSHKFSILQKITKNSFSLKVMRITLNATSVLDFPRDLVQMMRNLQRKHAQILTIAWMSTTVSISTTKQNVVIWK